MWLHCRSEEPRIASVTSYWRNLKLSAVGKSKKFTRAKEIGKGSAPSPPQFSTDQLFLYSIAQKSTDIVIGKYFKNFIDKNYPYTI